MHRRKQNMNYEVWLSGVSHRNFTEFEVPFLSYLNEVQFSVDKDFWITYSGFIQNYEQQSKVDLMKLKDKKNSC